MKSKTKFGLALAGVAVAVFYAVHKLTGKKAPVKAPAQTTSQQAHVVAPAAPPAVVAPAAAPHGSTVTQPNPATPSNPSDPYAPLPGQESLQGNVHVPGATSSITSSDGHYDGQNADGTPLDDQSAQTSPSQWMNTTPKQGTPPTKTLVVTDDSNSNDSSSIIDDIFGS